MASRPMALLMWNNEKNQDGVTGDTLQGAQAGSPKHATQLKMMKRPQPS